MYLDCNCNVIEIMNTIAILDQNLLVAKII